MNHPTGFLDSEHGEHVQVIRGMKCGFAAKLSRALALFFAFSFLTLGAAADRKRGM